MCDNTVLKYGNSEVGERYALTIPILIVLDPLHNGTLLAQ